jgi:hypothetical protein
MKNIFTGRIDHLNFEDGETVRSTQTIRDIQTVHKFLWTLSKCSNTDFTK